MGVYLRIGRFPLARGRGETTAPAAEGVVCHASCLCANGAERPRSISWQFGRKR